MLSSLLPGLRDLRVPLAAGSLWLLVLWLALYQVIPTEKEASGLAAEVYRVTKAFGPAALVAAVSFVAYLIGILVTPATSQLGSRVARVMVPGDNLITGSPQVQLKKPVSWATLLPASEMARKAAARAVASGVEVSGDKGSFAGERTVWDRNETAASAVRLSMEDDIPLVAARLLAHNRELFDRYDRADAEAGFRFAVSFPIALVSVEATVRLGAPWWGYVISIVVGMTIALLLIADGGRKQIEANDAIYQAVFVGEVTFPSIDNIDSTIQEKIRRQEQADPFKAGAG